MSIYFHNEKSRFEYKDEEKSKKWLRKILREENKKEGDLNIIFTDNPTILQLNKTYLSHNYLTDVIAFHFNHEENISGDIYISIDVVKENAILYGCEFQEELNRVMIHGLLHLIGYNDKNEKQRQEMRMKETCYLNIYPH